MPKTPKASFQNLSDIAKEKLNEMAKEDEVYNDFLKFQGRVYKQNAAVAVEFFAQRPYSRFIATAKQWEAVGYSVKGDSKAIRFIDEDSVQTDLYDFDQIEGSIPPALWSIDKTNVSKVKKNLGINDEKSLIDTMVTKTYDGAEVAFCMERLGVPPKLFGEFRTSYISSVKTIIAGRLEVGGNKFDVNASSSFYKRISSDNGRITFLSSVRNSAYTALIQIENTINQINRQNQINQTNNKIERGNTHEKTNLSRMGQLNRGGAGLNTRGEAPRDTERGTQEQSNSIAYGDERRREVLGIHAGADGGSENKAIPRIHSGGGIGSADVVQVQSLRGDIPNGHNKSRTVDLRTAPRALRENMARLDEREPFSPSGDNEVQPQPLDGGEVDREIGERVQGTSERAIRTDKSTTDRLVRGDSQLGENEGLLHRQPDNERTGFDSSDRALNKLNSILGIDEDGKTNPKENTLKNDEYIKETSAEKADVSLFAITAEIEVKKREFSVLISSDDFEKAAIVSLELNDLAKEAVKLKSRVQSKPIDTGDVEVLREITPKRKSVLNLVEEEVAKTVKFEKLLEGEMGRLSPYELRKNDTRMYEDEEVPVVFVEKRDVSKEIVNQDKKNGTIVRGNFLNKDTNLTVNFGKVGIDDTNHQTRNDITRYALYHAGEIIKNAVYLDSQLSEKKKKSPNSLFMHALYCPIKCDGEPYLAKLFVEEMFSKDENNQLLNTSNRMYNLKSIKIAPIAFGLNPDAILSEDKWDALDANIRISQLREIVKSFDESFYENTTAIGRKERVDEIEAEKEYVKAATTFESISQEVDDTNEQVQEEQPIPDKFEKEEQPTLDEPEQKEQSTHDEPKQEEQPLLEIVYAKNPNEKLRQNLMALRELMRIEGIEKSNKETGANWKVYNNKYNSKENSDDYLSRYSGWGGLPQVFDETNENLKWGREQLKGMLTLEEYSAVRESTLNSHYTPQIVIDAMYSAIKNMDLPRDAQILEPSCGTGNFIRRLSHAFSDAKVVGVEIDSITARICSRLNPDAKIIHNGFEHSNLDNNSFDLVIGNVPFGGYKLSDPDYTDDWLIHDAFFRKALDKVAPGGMVAFVTSSGTLDKKSPKIREHLAERAELVGAIRLPNNAFKDAGTKVTADIIFLQKRKAKLTTSDKMPDWCYTSPNADRLNVNNYFVNNPHMVLGKMEQTSHFDMLTCTPYEGVDLKEQLQNAIKNLNTKIIVDKRAKALKKRVGTVPADEKIKNFTFGKNDDGKMYYRKGLEMTEVKLKENEALQLEKLCDLRGAARELIDLQKTDISDNELSYKREELNKLYDSYVNEYGNLNSKKTHKIFSDDADYPLLCGLEEQDEKTGKLHKTDIFRHRTVNPQEVVTSAETAEQALAISIDRKGKPDIEFMAELLKSAPESVCDELIQKGEVFVDPEKVLPDEPYSSIVEKSEYLSGNVREKLKIAEMHSKINPDYSHNVKALEGAIPDDIPAEDISVKMGVPWIDDIDYTNFLRHLSGRNNIYSRKVEVHHIPSTGEFEVTNSGSRKDLNLNESTTYGTSDYSLYALADKILNQRRIAVKREVPDPDDPSKTIVKNDPKATKNALEKAEKIKKEFKAWIFKDEKRKAKYKRKYNDLFNCLVGREYDGSKLTFSGMNKDFNLRSHQKHAIARASMGGNALIAHVVGAGKSAVMFASVMKKKELGLISKACVVVPKALTEQIAREWRKLYPDARILTVSNNDLSSETKRNMFTARVATGSYDAVVLSQEQYEKIPMSKAFRFEFMQKQLDELEDALSDHKRESFGRNNPTVKQLETAKKRLKARIEKLTDPKAKSKAKDDLLCFEQLGFDYLVVDEAHAYKEL